MKISKVTHNNRKKVFDVTTRSGSYVYPYASLECPPTSKNRIIDVYVDKELAREGFTIVLESEDEESVHIEQVLDYNKDPKYLSELLLYKLTVEAQKRVESSSLSKRELIRRLGTSATQFYRLLDQTNDKKSFAQLLQLLHILECDVDLVIRDSGTHKQTA